MSHVWAFVGDMPSVEGLYIEYNLLGFSGVFGSFLVLVTFRFVSINQVIG